MLTNAKLFEVGHPGAMEPFYTLNLNAREIKVGHVLELDVFYIKLFARQLIN